MNSSAKYTRQGAIGIVKMVGDQTIFGAEALRTCALAALGDPAAKSIRIDCSKAGRIDCSGWQILTALVRESMAGGREAALYPADGPIHQTARSLGISLGNSAPSEAGG